MNLDPFLTFNLSRNVFNLWNLEHEIPLGIYYKRVKVKYLKRANLLSGGHKNVKKVSNIEVFWDFGSPSVSVSPFLVIGMIITWT